MSKVVINQHKVLNEVSFIRPILIILLVLYYSFAPWCGAWDGFDGFSQNLLYKAIGRISYSFMLPMFVFISGYVWAFQRETLRRIDSLSILIKKKIKRLYIPSVLFSLLYLILFKREVMMNRGGASVIMSGYAHMWFLPMLFELFIISYGVLNIKNIRLQFFVVLILFIVSAVDLPFNISLSLYYLVFFYLGYKVWLYADKIKLSVRWKHIIVSWLLFLISYILLTMLNTFLIKMLHDTIIWEECFNIIKLIYGILGVIALYLSAVFYTNTRILPNMIVQVGEYCFGVYIFQQFILHALYYHTNLPIITGAYLPWVCFVITIISSLTLAVIIRRFKWGKSLI